MTTHPDPVPGVEEARERVLFAIATAHPIECARYADDSEDGSCDCAIGEAITDFQRAIEASVSSRMERWADGDAPWNDESKPIIVGSGDRRFYFDEPQAGDIAIRALDALDALLTLESRTSERLRALEEAAWDASRYLEVCPFEGAMEVRDRFRALLTPSEPLHG